MLKTLKRILKIDLDNILGIAFLFSLFFPFRYLIKNDTSYISGAFSDFTSFSFYLSDFIFFLLLIKRIFKKGFSQILTNIEKPLYIFFLLISLNLFFSFYIKLNFYIILKQFELIVAYGTIKSLLNEHNKTKMYIFLYICFSSLQSLIAFAQFLKQSSLGLCLVGEQHISPYIYGIAKIVSDGTKFIRGYGTFPHPNPLSAFILIGIICSIYILNTSKSFIEKVAYSILTFINVLGILITFSRGAIISLFIVLFFLILLALLKNIANSFKIELLKSVFISAACFAFCFIVLKPFLLTRATFSDNSTMERKFYNTTGLKMISQNPLFGVGAGESLLHMEQYSQRTLENWEKQPPHNYFIALAAEFGILPTLIFIFFLTTKVFQIAKQTYFENSPEQYIKNIFICSVFVSVIFLMMFDHYFYTLQQTQFLLWTFLAFVSSETKNPSYQNKKGSILN